MARFLHLCRAVHRYARIGEDPPGTAPLTVANAEGVLAEIVAWVQDAYADIQSDQDDWLFRQRSGVLTAQGPTVDPARLADFGRLRCYHSATGRPYIDCAPLGAAPAQRRPLWRLDGSEQGLNETRTAPHEGTPYGFTLQTDGLIRLWPAAAAPCRLHLPYQRALHRLRDDGDRPLFDPEHHAAILWRALMLYADTRDGTQALYQNWERRRRQAMQRLYRHQLPPLRLS